jgi:hypothetical protein
MEFASCRKLLVPGFLLSWSAGIGFRTTAGHAFQDSEGGPVALVHCSSRLIHQRKSGMTDEREKISLRRARI